MAKTINRHKITIYRKAMLDIIILDSRDMVGKILLLYYIKASLNMYYSPGILKIISAYKAERELLDGLYTKDMKYKKDDNSFNLKLEIFQDYYYHTYLLYMLEYSLLYYIAKPLITTTLGAISKSNKASILLKQSKDILRQRYAPMPQNYDSGTPKIDLFTDSATPHPGLPLEQDY
ncbi:hypothetical protein DPV78_000280 [Talaromyces pinophilus]|nr:hypothetical protein DPV78_000280 [Talaromyces pinophilus]